MPTLETGGLLGIAAVERDSGLPKDTLRVWERRYGFPAPMRDQNDERVYPVEQLARLRLLRRLVDAGHRPGKVVGLPEDQLSKLLQDDGPTPDETPLGREILDLLSANDVGGLRDRMQALLVRSGLRSFVTEAAPTLAAAVGAAWARGELEIHQEHLFTEQFSAVLRAAINTARSSGAGTTAPGVLLTTIPQEPHALGLMMAEAMLVLSGCACISLGVQTPVPDIAAAARAHRVDIIALSFSAVVPQPQIQSALADLRSVTDPAIEIWAGGSGAGARGPAGTGYIASLEAIPPAVEAWRDAAVRRGSAT
jgi:DNA-binding transcriptional MerR regulator/methylmalonyl-CoA mutase cobalamin-binding subunit